MKAKPILFLYCQHSLGMGHLRRSMEIAKALVNNFHIVFFNGGRIPADIPRPKDIEFVDLPPLGMAADGVLFNAGEEMDLSKAKQIRKQLLLEHFERLKPDVLLLELFPFGRKKFAFEILPLLSLAKKTLPKPLVVCDLRDILVNDRRDQQRHDDRARWLCKRYFDTILIHTDPSFAQLQETFKPGKPLATPIIYTGFVTGATKNLPVIDKNPGIVVSAGGGNVGASLFVLAIAAQQTIWRQHHIPMTIVAGPFLSEQDWLHIKNQAQYKTGLTLYRTVPDLKCLLQYAKASISQCGYNTCMDLLITKPPALLIPYAEGRENEQSIRAEKLKKLGVVRVLPEQNLTAESLVDEVNILLEFKPATLNLQLNGAKQSCSILSDLLYQQQSHHTVDQYVA